MNHKYKVLVKGATIATFANRGPAIEYAAGFDNVAVKRQTNLTSRIVYSRSVTKSNGFITVSEAETFRAK